MQPAINYNQSIDHRIRLVALFYSQELAIGCISDDTNTDGI